MKLNTFRIILIVIILIVVLTLIVIGIIFLVKYIKEKKAKKKNKQDLSNNNSMNTSTQQSTNLSISQNVIKSPRDAKINAFCECFLKPVKYKLVKIYNDSCPIDFIKFEEDSEISVTVCQHGFHYECIKKYLFENEKNNNFKCPICLKVLFSLEDKSFQLG